MNWIYPDQPLGDNESITEYLLRNRKITDLQKFLNPQLTDCHNWRELHDAETAARAILQAVEDKQKIFIHGDFDVDGVSGTSILWDYMYRELKADVKPYIPSRFTQGYGLTESSITEMISQGAQLIISVDCGVKDVELVKKYTAQGIKFIITDHHTLPVDAAGKPFVSKEAVAVVHPRHPDKQYPFPEICGTAVSWKLICALNDLHGGEFDVEKYLDLVALATVCDVMPLTSENRVFVSHGLRKLRSTKNIGLQSLLKSASINLADIETYHLGFVIGPRINASGRMETALDAVRLLTTQSALAADQYAQKLQDLNVQRQGETQKLIAAAEEQLLQQIGNPLYFVYGTEWPEGIVGLVAGKLTEKYHRPVIVGSVTDGILKASARSISGFHISDTLTEVSHLLERYGGHELAAGLTLKVENLAEFQKEILAIASKRLSEVQLTPKLVIDVALPLQRINLDLVKEIEQLGPFGFGHPTPVIAVERVPIKAIRRFGKQNEHISFTTILPKFEIIGFNQAEQYQEVKVGDEAAVAGQLGVNEWNGNKTLQLRIKDIKQDK